MSDMDILRGLGWDISWQIEAVKSEFMYAASQLSRPSVVYKPAIYPDGNMWCALYGGDLVSGVSGFGETPAKAMENFDDNWNNQKTSIIAKDTNNDK